MRSVGSFVFLLALWLLLSGVYKPMIIGFGVVSVAIAVWVVHRMDAIDGDHMAIRLRPLGFLWYMLWLLVEIAKANWAVTKIVMAPEMKTRQHLFHVLHGQKTDLAQVVFANSITLTPGTITVETEPGKFLVHALAYSPEDMDALRDMNARVCATEVSA